MGVESPSSLWASSLTNETSSAWICFRLNFWWILFWDSSPLNSGNICNLCSKLFVFLKRLANWLYKTPFIDQQLFVHRFICPPKKKKLTHPPHIAWESHPKLSEKWCQFYDVSYLERLETSTFAEILPTWSRQVCGIFFKFKFCNWYWRVKIYCMSIEFDFGGCRNRATVGNVSSLFY